MLGLSVNLRLAYHVVTDCTSELRRKGVDTIRLDSTKYDHGTNAYLPQVIRSNPSGANFIVPTHRFLSIPPIRIKLTLKLKSIKTPLTLRRVKYAQINDTVRKSKVHLK